MKGDGRIGGEGLAGPGEGSGGSEEMPDLVGHDEETGRRVADDR